MTLEGPLAALREAEIRLLTDIADTLSELGATANEDRHRLLDVAQDLRELFFLVVVIGEFNAGKSSFINALLNDDLLPTGILPTTEAIELIRYADAPNRKPNTREGATAGAIIREWGHPNTGAPGVAIVDTPGTGSVFLKHETTAKSFLHRSDLVIFVISAKRAMTEAERLYLELAKNYGKKIIMVINQIDLLDAREQADVRRFVERQMEELLGMRPLMFMVSAKEARKAALALQTAISGDVPANDNPLTSGMDALRAHLRGVFASVPPAKQKLLAQLDMAAAVIQQYDQRVKDQVGVVTVDTNKVKDVQAELERQSAGMNAQLLSARAEIDRVLEGLRVRAMQFIDNNLSIRRLGRGISRESLQTQFQDAVIGRSLRDIEDATNNYINALIDNSRLYWRGVIDRLNQLRDTLDQELNGLDAGVYAEQREALQEAIRIADAELKSYSSGKIVGDIQSVFQANMNAFTTSALATFGGLVLVLLALAPAGPVIGAGALATATVAFVVGAPLAIIGGVAALRYYQRVAGETKRDMNARVDQLQRAYHEALNEITQKERSRLAQYGRQVLTPIFSRLDVLSQRYAMQQTKIQAYQTQIAGLRRGIEETRSASK
jgi:small GTP-binding protein